MRVLKARIRVLGETHRNTLMSMRNLATTWISLNFSEKAFSLTSNAVRFSETALGADDPESKDRPRSLNWWMGLYGGPTGICPNHSPHFLLDA